MDETTFVLGTRGSMDTNANNIELAQALAASRPGSFTGIRFQSKGLLRGSGSTKRRFNDPVVSATIVTGFYYSRLKLRSIEKLRHLNTQAMLGQILWENSIGLQDQAPRVVRDNLLAAINNNDKSLCEEYENSASVFTPLIVDGKMVRGASVYNGSQSDKVGCIYLSGLKIRSKVIVPPTNGWYTVNSSDYTKVNKFVRAQLPISRYVRYGLVPNRPWELHIGGVGSIGCTNQ